MSIPTRANRSMYNARRKKSLVLSLAAISAALANPAAFAQAQPDPDLEEIQVTGSRIRVTDGMAAHPVKHRELGIMPKTFGSQFTAAQLESLLINHARAALRRRLVAEAQQLVARRVLRRREVHVAAADGAVLHLHPVARQAASYGAGCGLPCVTTPVGGNPRIVSGPELGFLGPSEGPSPEGA